MYLQIYEFINMYVQIHIFMYTYITCTYMVMLACNIVNMYIHVCTMFRHVCTVLPILVHVVRNPDVVVGSGLLLAFTLNEDKFDAKLPLTKRAFVTANS